MRNEYKIYAVDVDEKPGNKVRYQGDIKMPRRLKALYFKLAAAKRFGLDVARVYVEDADYRVVTAYDKVGKPVLEFVRYAT